MTDIPKCPNCDAAEKRAISVVVCVSALGLEFLDECSDPTWQQAMEIVKKLKQERNSLAGLLRECLEFACPNGETPTSDLACRIMAALETLPAPRQASNPTDQRAGASPAPMHRVVGQTSGEA